MNEEKTGYGKRPLWQWIVLYVVVGGALYWLAYYVFFAGNGGYNYGTPAYAPVNNQATTPAPSPSPVAPASPQQVSQASIVIRNFAFSPKQISVRAGTKVTWTNRDSVAHTVTSNDGFFESGALGTGGTYSYVFPVPGTYSYHCSIHPSMTATVIVTQ